ncbi:DUF3857 domain-containing protein [Mucilaginibacter rubeus]|uniref:DUF3857 domain-containing protein n=1 Tax=Mucilaginibacter rubeus TaxID=2027860 RepID=A0AAE6MGV8_9SPHI|nr:MULTISPECIES: DUF3857 domain-containing protein [Mucilaginibacter]QEM02838.1 DUF3857 domain-containing protein [Mucilaginibacter rubeus]QEM15456.1 DUF3857 domain-containing protein [Mucilaginibacter gossypii]QTE41812.1 DUF3857 domain-containing protein [Mucilaginibacter rubeus]QTE48416.1 DUF3857 domain-containing protein [Mucilaginibacter rubeus]QTE59803.1 DUF3857 domain-containing protein [Mucilaginibacter rubeus]
MKKTLRLLFFFPLFAMTAGAQNNNQTYAEKAAEIQKEVWGTTVPEFATTKVPVNLSNESAVVFAKSYSMQRSLTNKFKFMIITASSTTRALKLTTFHERVKINDKSALEDFSTISYQKRLDESVHILSAKFSMTHDTYIGAKIIKPSGKEVVVNTSEEVLIKNEKKDQVSKLAISDLQVGDILDYYVSTVDVNENASTDNFVDNDMVFVLAGEYPVLYSSYDFQYSKKDNVKHICANGAPQFNISTNAAGDQIYSLKVRDQAKYSSEFWTSKFRQFPYIEISSSHTMGFVKFVSGGKAGESAADRLQANKAIFEGTFTERNIPYFSDVVDRLKKYFDGKKNIKAVPLDSAMKVLYNIRKGMVFGSYSKDDVGKVDEINYRRMSSKFNTVVMSMALNDLKIDHDVLLVCSRNANTLDNIFNYSDFDACIRINDTKPLYMFFDDAATHFNEIPQRFQGEKVIVLTPKRESSTKYSFTEGTAVLPVMQAAVNNINEDIKVSLLPANMQKIKIQRLVKQTGLMRHDDQLRLLPVVDIDNILMELSKSEKLEKRLAENPETKKLRDDFSYAFSDDESKSVKKFTSEIKTQYEQEPTQVTDCKIINAALDNSSPVFQYSESFVLDNLVKKAGNNYIIDAGKLAGSFYKLEEKERKRTYDVYMPCSRSFKYTINIAVPQGYTAKGLEEIAAKKTNKTGSFSSEATLNGNVVTIVITRVYNNNFEKAENWPLLSEVIDASAGFNAQKILFEKKS